MCLSKRIDYWVRYLHLRVRSIGLEGTRRGDWCRWASTDPPGNGPRGDIVARTGSDRSLLRHAGTGDSTIDATSSEAWVHSLVREIAGRTVNEGPGREAGATKRLAQHRPTIALKSAKELPRGRVSSGLPGLPAPLRANGKTELPRSVHKIGTSTISCLVTVCKENSPQIGLLHFIIGREGFQTAS